MLISSWRGLAHAGVSMGLSILCCAAAPSEPSSETSARRVSPSGGRFSIEFPAEPTCDANSELPDCRYADPTDEWLLRVSYGKAQVEGTPSAYLQHQLDRNAEEGGFEIKRQEPLLVGSFPALDYRFESIDGSTYQAAGRLVLVGAQLVDIEVGGEALPPEAVLQRFVNSLRVEEPSAPPVATAPAVVTPPAVATPPGVASNPAAESPTQPPPAVASTPPAVESPTPSPVSIATLTLLQARLLKPGAFQYQSIQEKLPEGVLPWSFTVGTLQRSTVRKRDKKRDAFVITDAGLTPAGKVKNSYWVDAKTLLPYRWEGLSPGRASMRLELVDGALRGERKGASPAKFDQPVGDKPLLFPGAPLELSLATLPLGQGFTGSLEVLEPEGLDTGKPVTTWEISVPFAGVVSGLGNLKKQIPCFKVELLERTEGKKPRKISLWIENAKVRRVLQTELLVPKEQGEDRLLQMIQLRR
ncbi:hypothetical protein D187_005154 [Cystobacter fuscus DSM 2262]|uniref:Uncharacterized protein n=1 Tax=Cystobacter fuscus (strain ATCC 25194 / DSM 2262 / NBRC 100088 / M29) TaxID=1242864 RepID=S9PLY8_CYSF2|nr:hypothetical protein [Cystobacter fuscus]EPX64021.1 hypothetical protein D187_005154 [Cystobacter fuscus DSM 2262]